MTMQTLQSQTRDGRRAGKEDAQRDFEASDPQDVEALIEQARENYHEAKAGRGKSYWLAYWGRLLDLRRAAIRRPRIGELRSA